MLDWGFCAPLRPLRRRDAVGKQLDRMGETGNVPVNIPARPNKAENRIFSGREAGKVFAPIGQIPFRVNRQGNEPLRGLLGHIVPVV